MCAMDLLSNVLHFYFDKLPRKEKLLLEAIFFAFLYQELATHYKTESNQTREVSMINDPVICNLVNDLLINNDYSIQGLADYTGYPEDVIYDLAAGMNTNPTILLSTKIIQLHAIARRDLYNTLLKKVITKLASMV